MPARQHRITRGDDYRRVVRSGHRVGGAYCITHAVLHAPTSDSPSSPVRTSGLPGTTAPEATASEVLGAARPPARFGFIISKAVGGAVTRNLVRRRLKTIVEQRLHEGFRGADIVFRALPASATAEYSDLEREVFRALDRVEGMQLRQLEGHAR